MTVTVKPCKVVRFSAGYLSLFQGENDNHVRWAGKYCMIIFAGRGNVVFTDGNFLENPEESGFSDAFSKRAVRNCFKRALSLPRGERELDHETGIRIRRFRDHATFEIRMPCGEEACLKQATLKRLVKELA